MKAKILPYFFATGLALAALNFQACKNPADTMAVVTVYDISGQTVSGATVHLIGVDSNGDPGGRIDVTETTGSDGVASFNFNEYYKRGAAGFTVLDAYADKDTLGAKGIIKVEEEKTNTLSLTIEDQ